MKKPILLFLFFLFSAIGFSQPFSVGHVTVSFIDSTRSNRNIETEIYYPADVNGDNVPITTTNSDAFPVLCFGHGFVMTWDAYANIWNAVVPQGFVIAFPKTEGSLSPSHNDFGIDFAFVLSSLSLLNADANSIFYNRLDSMTCVMGHSMGGGASFLAPQFGSLIKAIAVLAPAETNPSAIAAAGNIAVPALVISGANDCVTPPISNQIPMYDSLQSNCKTLVTITGGSHCQMAENNFLCSFGEATCSPSATITRAEQHSIINRFLIPWLKYQLKNDCNAGAQFDSLLIADTSITFQKNCLLCNTISVEGLSENSFVKIFPNPTSNGLVIEIQRASTIIVYDNMGREVLNSEIEKGMNKINLGSFAEGIYSITIRSGDYSTNFKIVVRR